LLGRAEYEFGTAIVGLVRFLGIGNRNQQQVARGQKLFGLWFYLFTYRYRIGFVYVLVAVCTIDSIFLLGARLFVAIILIILYKNACLIWLH
jgi:hypothetical protein